MTATDELRRLLDERGVEWTSGCTEVSRNICTDFCPDTGISMSVWESGDGKLGIDAHTNYLFTPEQAVEVTLGRKTCEADETDLIPFVRADSGDFDVDYIHVMECSACGGTYEHVSGSYEFCPRCGRKVIDE